MSEYGISSTGFKRKRLNLLLEELNSEVKAIFGDNFNVSPESPDGQINGVVSESNANLWELAEEAYNAFNPKAASGAALSNLVQLNRITRRPEVASKATVILSGDQGTVVPEGSLISASSDITFSTNSSVTIPASGSIQSEVTAVVVGPLQALADTLINIDTPISGWDSVTNPEDAVLGADEESDSDLRARRERSVTVTAKAILDTILAGILSVDAVKEAFIYENDTNSLDSVTSTPARQFQAVVLGGTDEAIAKAIYNDKPIGIGSFGSTTVAVSDTQGFTHDINFTRPIEVAIYVTVTISLLKGFPVEGSDNIKSNILNYAEGNLVTGRGFGVGSNIITSELYTPINLVAGHTVNSLLIGKSSSPATDDDIIVDFNEISSFNKDNIIVNIAS